MACSYPEAKNFTVCNELTYWKRALPYSIFPALSVEESNIVSLLLCLA